MKSPGVRLVREAIDAYNRRDVEALTELMAPDVDLQPPVTALRGIAYRGHPGIRDWLADVDESFARAQIEPIEFEERGGLVLAITSFAVEGGESHLEFDSELGLLCEIQGGRIVSWKGHFNHAAARAEARGRAAAS
jgi:ketosteroid isomerase-like protein